MTDYTTVQRVRAAFGSEVTNADDAVIARLITAVSGQIDHACHRPDGFAAAVTATAREYPSNGGLTLAIDECVSVSTVETRATPAHPYTAWGSEAWRAFSGAAESPDYTRTPFSAIIALRDGLTFPGAPDAPSRPPLARVTARWGYASATPGPVELACIIGAVRLYQRGMTGFQTMTANASERWLIYAGDLDPAALSVLREARLIRPRI